MSDHAVGKHVGYDLNSEETMKAPVIASDPRAAAVRALIPLLLLSAAAILWAASGSSTTIERRLTFTSLSVTAVAWAGVALIVGRRTPHHSLLRLGPWMLLYGGITFGLASPTAWLAPQSLSNALSLESFLDAHWMMVIGFLTFTIGYLTTPRAGLHRLLGKGFSRAHRWDTYQDTPLLSAILTYSLGFGALLLAAALSGRYGYLGDATVLLSSDVSWYTAPLQIVSSLRGFAILYLWVVTLRQGSASKAVTAVTITTIDLIAGLLSGMKEVPITTLMAVGIAYVFVKRRLPILGVAAIGAWFTFFLSPLVTALRQIVRGNGALTLQEALPQVVSGLRQTSADAGGNVWETLARVRLIDNLAITNQKTPSEIPFQSIADLFSQVLSGFIPRAIWPTKPVRIDGLQFYQDYYGGTTYSSSAVTVPGSLYMYGGMLILFLGMLLFGMLTRSLDDGMHAHERVTGLLLFFALLPSFVKMEASAPTLLASLVPLGVGWLIASWLLLRASEFIFPSRDKASKPTRVRLALTGPS